MVFLHYFLKRKNNNRFYSPHAFSFLPSLANPKSVNLRIASLSLLVKSKFSGFKSPIIITREIIINSIIS